MDADPLLQCLDFGDIVCFNFGQSAGTAGAAGKLEPPSKPMSSSGKAPVIGKRKMDPPPSTPSKKQRGAQSLATSTISNPWQQQDEERSVPTTTTTATTTTNTVPATPQLANQESLDVASLEFETPLARFGKSDSIILGPPLDNDNVQDESTAGSLDLHPSTELLISKSASRKKGRPARK